MAEVPPEAAVAVHGGGSTVHVLWIRRTATTHHHGEVRALPSASLDPADAHAPVEGPGDPARVAALRALFVATGVLLTRGDAPLSVETSDELRRAYDRSAEEGHRRLAAAGHRYRTDALRAAGTFPASGDVVAHDTLLFLCEWTESTPPRPRAGAWVPVDEALAGWSRGQEIVTPTLGRVLRLLERGASEVAAPTAAWEVAPDVRMMPVRTPTLPPATHTNTFLVGSGEAVLVEPASPYPEEIDRLVAWVEHERRQGIRPKAIVATHHHPDHVGGAVALAERLGLPLWAHAGTAQRLEGQIAFHRLLEDGEPIELAGPRPLTLRCLHTPGHAPGHLCLLEERSRAMIAGDMVAGVGTILVEPHDGDMTLYLDSLRRMQELAPSMLLPAHGGVIAEPDRCLAHYVAHRLEREAKVREALRAHGGPASARELVPLAYDDVPEAIWPIAVMAAEAHLLKLVADGEARRDGARFVPARASG